MNPPASAPMRPNPKATPPPAPPATNNPSSSSFFVGFVSIASYASFCASSLEGIRPGA